MYYSFVIIDYAALITLTVSMFIVDVQQSGYSQKLMSSLCSWCCFIAFGFCVKITGSDLTTQLLGQKIVYVAFLHALYFMLLFTLDFCNSKLPGLVSAILLINNTAMSAVTLFMDKHTLFYTSYGLTDYNNVQVFKGTYGILHTVYTLEMLLYFIIMMIFLLRNTLRSSKQVRRSSILLLIALITPFICYFLQRMIDFPFDLAPMGFILSGLIMLDLIYVERIYNVSDIARDYIFETMSQAFIVTDGEYRYKGSNNLAKLMFPELIHASQDEDLYSISFKFRQIVNGDITEQINFEGRMYEPSVKRITENNTIAGVVISLNDVTSQYEYKALQDSYREELQAEVNKQTEYAEQRHKKVEEMSVQLVQTLANAIDAKDKYTNGHSSRVAEYAVRLATSMGWKKDDVDILRYEGLLHDIGKIGIPDVILNKSDRLTENEFNKLKSHVNIGGDIMHDASTLPGAENVIRYHHERYDGTGYPDGLKGDQIPVDARIVSIVDTYDAMSSNRVYRRALPKDVIKRELLKERGKQFDPDILDKFISLFDRGLLDDVAPKDNGWFD
jgi:HD-GYP domain-containing protein (c-di-GMP phosphodiesterase class II)